MFLQLLLSSSMNEAEPKKMPAATTIVVAREDFSIPGGENYDGDAQPEPVVLESRFFSLLRDSKPDVVVLDLRQANGDGCGMILKIRRQCSVPILVVCGQDNPNAQDYRFAGAAECIASPVDVVVFNEVCSRSCASTAKPRRQARAKRKSLSFPAPPSGRTRT
jgi:CheY-like chemotaxis protein